MDEFLGLFKVYVTALMFSLGIVASGLARRRPDLLERSVVGPAAFVVFLILLVLDTLDVKERFDVG